MQVNISLHTVTILYTVRMEGNFWRGKPWRMTMNLPNLNQPNFMLQTDLKYVELVITAQLIIHVIINNEQQLEFTKNNID